ncbi:hypothetical protein B484DRAFT_431862 [Ochromonadaceae sp. CCMP2298]|nr:hypothetical protein B484DRAFT_431862 [Ochromonadaceae sp. CCMP2298]
MEEIEADPAFKTRHCIKLVQCTNGNDLYAACMELPKNGKSVGLGFSMNRGIKELKNAGFLVSKSAKKKIISWGKSSDSKKTAIKLAMHTCSQDIFATVKASILQPFRDPVKKESGADDLLEMLTFDTQMEENGVAFARLYDILSMLPIRHPF